MSQQNKTQLQSLINTNIADNTVGDITAQDVRDSLINVTDSLLFNSGSQTFDGTLTATAFVGDGSAITGVTGEWDGSLNGNAEISGSLIVSGSVVDFTNATAISGSTFSGSFVGDGSGLTGIDTDPFPYTGNASFTGTTSMTGSLTISDSLDVTNFITASKISINDGGDSVFVGEFAGLNDDGTSNQNVGIGIYALLSNTTGFSNTATGKNSLLSNIAGHSNTANGAESLRGNTNGNYNTATGLQSLYQNIQGNGNTANGAYSLQSNTTGFYNTAVGYLSMFSNVDGINNTANGYGSLQDNTNGEYNTATGGRSLSENTTGDNNIAFGYESGRFITGGSTNNAITNNSVYLGSLTKAKANNETNQIVIGYNTTGNGSNTVTIGNSSITNNYFNGDVSATSFTGNGATISGSLIASGSVVDFTDATAISGSTFSGSFVGDGSGLTNLPSTSGTAKMYSGVFTEVTGGSPALALTTERNDFDSTSPLIATRLGVGYWQFTFSGGAFDLNSSNTVYSFQPTPANSTVGVGFYSADTQGANTILIFARDTTGAMADGILGDVEFRITQFSS